MKKKASRVGRPRKTKTQKGMRAAFWTPVVLLALGETIQASAGTRELPRESLSDIVKAHLQSRGKKKVIVNGFSTWHRGKGHAVVSFDDADGIHLLLAEEITPTLNRKLERIAGRKLPPPKGKT